jgi:hypothetical protein
MKYLNKNSLFKTIDNVSEAFLFGPDMDQNKNIKTTIAIITGLIHD